MAKEIILLATRQFRYIIMLRLFEERDYENIYDIKTQFSLAKDRL